MSFIRKKFSRVWNRGSDDSSWSSQEVQRTSISSEHTGHSDDTIPSILGSIREGSPGRLHKAASTTFQTFSDTIRAKTQMFYSNPSKPGIAEPESPEAKTPRKHGQRSSIWPSARARQGLTDRTNKNSTADSPGSPSAKGLEEPAPALDVTIPDPSLTGLRISTENETPMKRNYGSKQLWPTPTRIACPPSPQANSPFGPTLLPPMDDPYTESPYTAKRDLNIPRSRSTASDVSKYHEKDDAGYISDVESIADPVKPDGFSPAETRSPSYFTPSTTTVAKTPHSGKSLFVKGDQARVHFHRTPSPFQKAKQTKESPLFNATAQGGKPDSILESPLTVVRSDSSVAVLHRDPPETVERQVLSDSPLARRPVTFEKRSVVCRPDPSAAETTMKAGRSRLPSHVYEADTESAASRPGTPIMGSRNAWNEARADRNDRYIAIYTMSETTNSDDFDSELELLRSPSRKPIHLMEEYGGVNLSEREQARPSDYVKVPRDESRNPSNASLQNKLEALELLESSCEVSSDSDAIARSPFNPLRYYMEANSKISGIALDEFLLDSAFPELDAHIFDDSEVKEGAVVAAEDVSSATDEAFGQVVSASSSDGGQKSYEDIQKVENTLMTDDEFQDIVHKSNVLQRLVAASMLGLSERQVHRRRLEMSKTNEEDVLPGSVKISPTPSSTSNDRQTAGGNACAGDSSAPDEYVASQLYAEDFESDDEILEITVMDGETSQSFALANNTRGSSPVQRLQPNDGEAFTNALRSAGISRRSLEKGKVLMGNPPNTPIDYSRSVSTDSVRTTESCAITTSSPVCFAPPPFPTLHVRSSPVRSTSSIIARNESDKGQGDEGSSTHSQVDRRTPTRDDLENIVRERLELENASSPSYAEIISPATAGNRAESTLKGYLESPESLHLFEFNTSHTSPSPAPPASPLIIVSKRADQTLPFRLKADKSADSASKEISESSPKKVSLDEETQILGDNTDNKGGKKKRKNRRKRRSKKSDASGVQEPVKSTTPAMSPRPLGKALGSMGNADSPVPAPSATKGGGPVMSSHEKGIWWARKRDREVVGSPLAGKRRRGDGYEQNENSGDENMIAGVVVGGEGL